MTSDLLLKVGRWAATWTLAWMASGQQEWFLHQQIRSCNVTSKIILHQNIHMHTYYSIQRWETAYPIASVPVLRRFFITSPFLSNAFPSSSRTVWCVTVAMISISLSCHSALGRFSSLFPSFFFVASPPKNWMGHTRHTRHMRQENMEVLEVCLSVCWVCGSTRFFW